MTQRDRRFATMSALLVAALAACTTPNLDRHRGSDAGPDEPGDSSIADKCTADQALRCDGANVVRCNADGTAAVREPCSLGCNAAELRCATDIDPSNGLAPFLDRSDTERDLDLGSRAAINTDTGEVKVGGTLLPVRSETLAQDNAPTIRVFVVHSLTTGDVDVRGNNALAIVSHGDVKIGGVFQTVSDGHSSPGMFNNDSCMGGEGASLGTTTFAWGGVGGGGFGSPGGRGGSATSSAGTADGGLGGAVTGNATLTPLRGGCGRGPAGGAIQLVSRTRIVIAGAVAANGEGGVAGLGGNSGGGILLEAPAVELEQMGKVVANGGGGSGGDCVLESPKGYRVEAGRLDATQARGGTPCGGHANGGSGAAGNADATNGDADNRPTIGFAVAAAGGGGAGRIRINTIPDGFRSTGLVSPTPSSGSLATR